MKSLFFILVLIGSCFASSYLDCKVYRSSDNQLVKFSLKLDEEASKITFSTEDSSIIDNGYFAPSVIRFTSNKEVGGSLKRNIEVNRETLDAKMSLIIVMPDRTLSAPTNFNGKCEVKKNKNKI